MIIELRSDLPFQQHGFEGEGLCFVSSVHYLTKYKIRLNFLIRCHGSVSVLRVSKLSTVLKV